MRDSLNPRLVRVVATHFEDLQGLRTAAFGLALALCTLVGTMPGRDLIDGVLQLAAALVPLTFALWASHAVGPYYARRLGRVVRGRPIVGSHLLYVVWVITAALALKAGGSLRLFWVAWTVYPVYVAWSAWPYRVQHLLVAAVGCYVAWPRLSGSATLTGAAVVRDMYVLASALVVAGLADHFVLLRALPGAFRLKAETTEPE